MLVCVHVCMCIYVCVGTRACTNERIFHRRLRKNDPSLDWASTTSKSSSKNKPTKSFSLILKIRYHLLNGDGGTYLAQEGGQRVTFGDDEHGSANDPSVGTCVRVGRRMDDGSPVDGEVAGPSLRRASSYVILPHLTSSYVTQARGTEG